MKTTELKLNAEWTNDCQGKKDYDGDILSISTRYWPRGGSHMIFSGNQFISDGSDPQRQSEIRPSATSSLVLWHGQRDSVDIVKKDFEADTEQEVREQVEKWAQEQMNKVVEILQGYFYVP